MKRSLLFLLFVVPVVLTAQYYQNICSPGITFYRNNSGTILAFRLDSTDVSQNPDTVFYSYRAIREPQGGDCYDTTSGCFLGLMVTKKPSGVFQFYNKDNAQITLHTTEGLGYSWTFFSYPSGDYIEASIVSLNTDTILGIVDSVKVIEFQAKDNTGNNIAHILNAQQIKLSKHYGLTRMLDIYSIPTVSVFYTLLGKTSPPVGIQNITWNEVYNYSVGDVFHFHGSQYTSGVYVDIKVIWTILDKVEIPDSNRIIYTIEWCQKKKASVPPPNVIFAFDTITQTVNFQSDTSYILELPLEFIRLNEATRIYSRVFSEFNGRQTHKTFDGIYYGSSPPCWNPPFEYASSQSFTPGLGRTRYSSSEVFESYSIQLIYFKKGSEEWGNPVATSCNILVSDELQNLSHEFRMAIYPNPVRDRIIIQLDEFEQGSRLEFKLFDYVGKEVYQTMIRYGRVTLNRPPLPGGLYIWQVTGETGTATGRLVLE